MVDIVGFFATRLCVVLSVFTPVSSWAKSAGIPPSLCSVRSAFDSASLHSEWHGGRSRNPSVAQGDHLWSDLGSRGVSRRGISQKISQSIWYSLMQKAHIKWILKGVTLSVKNPLSLSFQIAKADFYRLFDHNLLFYANQEDSFAYL